MNFRTMDLNLLRVFMALEQARNVTQAADRLGLSQPAVSAALARLRDQLGDPLFVRVGNGMAPTPRAEAVAPAIRDALARLESALTVTETFRPETAVMTFSLLGADFFSMRLMPPLAVALATEAPGISMKFLDSAHGDFVRLLEAGAIDLALERPIQPPGWVSKALLFPSPFRIVAAKNNPAIREAGLAAGDTLPLDLFCALPHALRSTDGSMSGMTDDALARQGRTRRVALAVPHFDAVLEVVAQSHMISSVPVQLLAGAARADDLIVLEAPIEIPTPNMQLYWHSRLDRTPAHGWFRNRVLAEVARLWGHDARFD